jgi:hypothetical protein
MVNGDQDRDETRAFARLPGLDIAVLHRGTRADGGAQVVIALRAMPTADAIRPPTMAASDPFLFWVSLTQAAWTSWLACLAAASTPLWIARGR